jgi:hypothetical protein
MPAAVADRKLGCFMMSVIDTLTPWRAALAAAVLLGAGGLAPAARANIVADPGFEQADTAGVAGDTDYFLPASSIDGGSWNVTAGLVGVDTQDAYVFDGNKSVFLNGSGGVTGQITQTLATVIGATYSVSFWADADTTNTFSVTLGGLAVAGAPASIAQNGFPSDAWLGNSSEFALYTGTVTATAASSDLVFTATDLTGGPGVTVEIDDVSVSAVPEPTSLPVMATGMLAMLVAAGWRRCRARAR